MEEKHLNKELLENGETSHITVNADTPPSSVTRVVPLLFFFSLPNNVCLFRVEEFCSRQCTFLQICQAVASNMDLKFGYCYCNYLTREIN